MRIRGHRLFSCALINSSCNALAILVQVHSASGYQMLVSNASHSICIDAKGDDDGDGKAHSDDREDGSRVSPCLIPIRVPASSQDEIGAWTSGLTKNFPKDFGGVTTEPNGTFVVLETHHDTSLETFSQTTFDSLPINSEVPVRLTTLSFRSVANSLASLYRIQRDIWTSPNFSLIGGIGINDSASKVVVIVPSMQVATKLEPVLATHYGSTNIAIAIISNFQLDQSVAAASNATRYADYAPWNGGDQIVGENVFGVGGCTTGFGFKNSSGNFISTDGHCNANVVCVLYGCGVDGFSTNETWYNINGSNETQVPAIPPSCETTCTVGSTDADYLSTGYLDNQLIPTSSSCIVWGDQSTEPGRSQWIFVTGVVNAWSGAQVLQEGSYSFQQSGDVLATDIATRAPFPTLVGMMLTSAKAIHGDSGGPVILPSIYGPLATGTIEANANDTSLPPTEVQILGLNYKGPATLDTQIDTILYWESLVSQSVGSGLLKVNTAVAPERCPSNEEGAGGGSGSPEVKAQIQVSGYPGSITTNGSAEFSNGLLRLNDISTGFESGSAYWDTPIALSSSFKSHFILSLHNSPNVPADGISYIIQSKGLDALGGPGMDEGFAGAALAPWFFPQAISPSVEVEFNDYQNASDPNSNHVAILTNGLLENECAPPNQSNFTCTGNYVYGTPSFSLYGNTVNVWVEYSALNTTLSVYVSLTNEKPTTPLISTRVSLESIVGKNAYLGFTGATGGYQEYQDILEWEPTT